MYHEVRKSVWDAVEACRKIQEFSAGCALKDYLADEMRRRAIERLFEILGEALNRVDVAEPSFRDLVPEMGNAIGMRNRIAHGYDRVRDEAVWLTAKDNVPALYAKLDAWLKKNG